MSRHFDASDGMIGTEAVLRALDEAIIAFDPNRVDGQDLAVMRSRFRKLARRLNDHDAELRRNHSEVEELQQAYHRHLYAARVLAEELECVGSANERATVEARLAELIDELERLKPTLLKGRRQNSQAEIRASQVWSSFDGLAMKLKHAAGTSRLRKSQELATPLPSPGSVQMARASTYCEPTSRALAAINNALDAIKKQEKAMKKGTIRCPSVDGSSDHRQIGEDCQPASESPAAGSKAISATTSIDATALRERLARLNKPTAITTGSAVEADVINVTQRGYP